MSSHNLDFYRDLSNLDESDLQSLIDGEKSHIPRYSSRSALSVEFVSAMHNSVSSADAWRVSVGSSNRDGYAVDSKPVEVLANPFVRSSVGDEFI